MFADATNTASTKKRRWLKVVIAATVVCVLALVGVYLYGLWEFGRAWERGRENRAPLPKVDGISDFPLEYATHVSQEVAGAFFDIARWYAPEAVYPDLAQVRGSLCLPPFEDWLDGDLPYRAVVIEANLADALSERCFSPETGFYRRISRPGEAPAFLWTFDGEGPAYELRHDPGLGKTEALLTFELHGTDPASGATRRERHHLRLVEDPDARDGLFEPPFLITSHTIEALAPAQEQ